MTGLRACGEWKWGVRQIWKQRFLRQPVGAGATHKDCDCEGETELWGRWHTHFGCFEFDRLHSHPGGRIPLGS